MAKHSEIGASTCARWWNCPGSVALARTVPKPPPSPYAEEGTAAHELAERSLRAMTHPSNFVGEYSENGYEFTEEMAEAVAVYYDTIHSDIDEMFGGLTIKVSNAIQIEHSFHLDWIDPKAFGTNDCNIGQPFGLLRVYDYKHGAGVPVEANNNKQGLYYALGAAAQGDYSEVEIVIVQPRAMHPDGPVRRYRISIEELRQFGRELSEAIERTKKKDAHLEVGSWCRFCPALAVCPKARASAQEVAQMDFTPVKGSMGQPPDPQSLTNEQLGKILEGISILDAWIKSVSSHAQERAEQGQEIPGFKLVKKRATRKWVDEDAVISRYEISCGDEIFTKKLKSPTQLEKVLKNEKGITAKDAKQELEELVDVPDTGVVLVPASDARHAVAPPAQTDFAAVEHKVADLF